MTIENNENSYERLILLIGRHHDAATTYASQLRIRQSLLKLIELNAIIAGTVLAFAAAIINDKSVLGEWRYICGAIGGFNLIAGVCITVAKRWQLDERLRIAESCEGKLNAIVLALREGTKPHEEILAEYMDVVEQNPRILKVTQSLRKSHLGSR